MTPAWLERRAGMPALGDMHDEIAELLPKDGRVLYLDYAFTTNVGDMLIVLGTLAFFRRHGIAVRQSRNIHNIENRGLRARPGDVLVFHGGGNFGDIYPHFQKLRERIVAASHANKVVIMPQTVHFKDPSELDRSCRILAAHPDITLFLRDHRSLALVQPYFGDRAKLAPDMAHQLYPSLADEVSSFLSMPLSDPMFMIRRDDEKSELPSSLMSYNSKFTDWGEMTSFQYKVKRRLLRQQYALAKRGLRLLDLDKAYFSIMRDEVIRTARGIYQHPIWITSRMHGAILGLLLGKPVFVLDNSYGKLSSYFEAWDRWANPITLVTSPEQTDEMLSFIESTQKMNDDERWLAYSSQYSA